MQSVAELEVSAAKGQKDAKKELARRLLEGDGTDKNEAKAASLLEDCAAHGDAVSMLTLAKCAALGRGVQQDARRAETLLREAAQKGSKEAQSLLEVFHKWEGFTDLDLNGLGQENNEGKSEMACSCSIVLKTHRAHWWQSLRERVCPRSEHHPV